PALIPYTQSDIERRRIAATVALGKIGEPEAIPALFERINDPYFTVRSAALYALVNFDEEIFKSLKLALRSRDEVQLERALLLTGALARKWVKEKDNTSSPVKRLRSLADNYLAHPVPRVRSASLVAAAPFLKRDILAQLIKDFEAETDPVVLARCRAVRREFNLP
ncbi:HEAT repeat domain-containing protein, partial [bacterium]|nr:HEAT repeat domain-containing protein [bacterium]